MPDLVLTLGGVQFRDFEVPDKIAGMGGDQMLAIHRLIGGARVIDSMGRDDAPLEWSGRFRGRDAQSRARAIDALRIAGKEVILSFGDVLKTVKIHRFLYEFERFYEGPYSIVLEVLTDVSQSAADRGVDGMMRSDNDIAQALGLSIGDGSLTGLLGTLGGAITSVSNFAKSAQAEINSVLQPIQAVQGRVTTLIAMAENTMQSVTTLGGVLPNNPVSQLVANLGGQVSAVTRVANLYDLQNIAGRMSANLGAVGASGARVTTAGGDLYTLAERSYGDATAWPVIAKANGLTDPMLTGVQSLLVPPSGGSTGGVLQP